MTQFYRYILVILAVLQPLSGALAPITGIGSPIGNATANSGAPEQPLPVFFSIWSIIFLSYLIFAVIYLVKNEPWMDRVARPLGIAGALNILWMLSAQLIAYQPLDFALLFPIGTACWVAARRFDRVRGMGGSPAKFFADMTSGLLSGWITVAVAISVPLTLRSLTNLGPTDHVWPMLWVALCTAMLGAYLFASRFSKSLWFFVAAGWGLLGVTLNNWLVTHLHLLAIATAIIGTLILITRWRRGASGALLNAPTP